MTISAYCERLDDAFWAEPLNAVSNCAFLIAALIAYLAWQRRTPEDGAVAALIALVGLIGIGSFLFHTMPSWLTVLLDVVPIQLFVLGYFTLVLRRFIGLPRSWALVGLVSFAGFSVATASILPRSSFAGSLAYLPALAALFGFAVYLTLRSHETGRPLLVAATLFAVSLIMRTLDQPLCGSVPIGLHFVWHCLNGCLLGLLLITAIRAGSRDQTLTRVS